jgi:alpha-L-fucosidase
MGQRIKSFTIRVQGETGAAYEIKKTTVGSKRILTFPAQTAVNIRIYVTGSKATPLVSEVDAYLITENLVDP